MGASVEELLTSAMGLSADDRVRLAEALLSTVEAVNPAFDPEWMAEVHRWAARIDAGVQSTKCLAKEAPGGRSRRD